MQQPGRGQVRQLAATHGASLLAFVWFLFMATASAWLPAYNGIIDGGDRRRLFGVYLLIAVIAAISLRARALTRRDAVVSSLPALGLLVVAAVAGLVFGLSADGRGSPLFLFFAVALWASWVLFVLSTTLLTRTRWNRLALAVTVIVALVGVFMAGAQID